MSRQPLFLGRRSYAHRRRADAARLLPLAGLFLLLLPIGGTSSSRVLLTLMGVWIALILASALLSRGLGRGPEQ